MLLWFMVIATIPAGIAGKLLEHSAEEYFREHIFLIAGALIVVALLMWLGEKVGKLEKPLTKISLVDSLAIGVAQAFALIPGVSRSGSTITAGLFRGLTRDAAVRFSFLLSTPLIAGAALLKAHELRKEGLPAEMHMPFIVGDSGLGAGWLCGDCMAHSLFAVEQPAPVHHLPHHRGSGRDCAGVHVALAITGASESFCCKNFQQETTSTLAAISFIVGTVGSWHNSLALADCGAGNL